VDTYNWVFALKILGTTDITHRIEYLLQESTSFLIFVSPYMKLNNRLQAKMSACFEQVKEVLILYRKGELNKTEKDWLTNLSNMSLIPIQNLHAKIYMNEHRCLITSMNLYEYSQVNNHEIGIEFEAEANRKEFMEVLKEIKLILSSEKASYNFDGIMDHSFVLPVRKLFHDGMTKHNLFGQGKNDFYYLNFSNWMRTQVEFTEEELYQDKSAVLRSTNLGRERYKILKRELDIKVFKGEK